MMIGFILSVIMGLILIPLLKRLKIKQKVSVFLKKRHQEKNGTPTMGGLIFIIPTILTVIILLFMNKIELTENLFIVMFVFIAYALLGFIDDYLSIKRGHNEGLTEIQKLFGQLLIALIFFYIFMRSGSSPVLDIHTLGIKINMGWFYGIFLLFVLVASSNAVNLTDGLDGLAGGLSAIAFLAFALISWNSKYVAGSEDIAIFCFILVGSLLGFLLFNTHPAKVFMGDTGSLALGGTLASVAIITSHEITLIIVAGVFVVETLACIIQMISVRYFHRKVFLMAPLHHHFEKLGWDERDVVKVFWTVGLMLSMAAIAFGVWI
ncbi:MAG TPA: phospho-N-acetylmuramoyl-pentapeptide-transferase [Candidatus Fimihabitans intestinipullorum]|uniref:Phospho-N-acetylmuramoyl-pentapeptide-transferase n=1 Tax=Candidatus Fimihabitans intestinipullorum TaxID=2840820 RepID=A0A9D1HTX5_9BACT|nr:phospho-N-acetylmuramoyl-pentapeptide-transferase [Candidatus Fimihabitans intestinipullorum]